MILPDPDGGGVLRHGATRNSYDRAGRLIRQESGQLAVGGGGAVGLAGTNSSWSMMPAAGATLLRFMDRVKTARYRRKQTDRAILLAAKKPCKAVGVKTALTLDLSRGSRTQ